MNCAQKISSKLFIEIYIKSQYVNIKNNEADNLLLQTL